MISHPTSTLVSGKEKGYCSLAHALRWPEDALLKPYHADAVENSDEFSQVFKWEDRRMRRVEQPPETETSFTCVYGWCPILRAAARHMCVSKALVKDLHGSSWLETALCQQGEGWVHSRCLYTGTFCSPGAEAVKHKDTRLALCDREVPNWTQSDLWRQSLN